MGCQVRWTSGQGRSAEGRTGRGWGWTGGSVDRRVGGAPVERCLLVDSANFLGTSPAATG